MNTKHLLEIDQLSGEEYCMWDVEWYIPDADYFFERAREVKPIKYAQNEFKDMPTTLCTLYGNLNALATRTGREFTVEERRELCNLRKADKDYHEETGWYTAEWCNTVRRWWNTRYPENPIVTFAIEVNSELGRKFFAKSFPVSTSVRLNSKYSIDARDWKLDATSWGKSSGGHCRMRCGMKFHDNYKPKEWREYEYPTMERYLESLKNWYERPIMHAFFLENELSTNWQKLVKYMKMKCWSWERENEPITRYEVAQIAKRLAPKIEEKKLWNWTNPQKEASKYETSVMFNRAIGTEIYLWTDRNKSLTRKQAILMLP
jgi:hypothetical protein